MSNDTKKENCGLYKLFRGVLGPIYKFYYHPKIKGKENIIKDGPIIVVGNHIHIMDQCNPIVMTKRCIHYMAKKEYFDKQYKEGKFPWFFKGAGCIPVDRSIKDTGAVDSALEVLRDGYAIGLFPEGTRNAVKEEKAKELYDKYQNELKIDFKTFYEGVKKEKTSQIDFFEELLNTKRIERQEFIDNIYVIDNFLRELVIKKRLDIEEYFEHVFLPFKFGAVSMAQKTNATIIPFVTTGKYRFRSSDLNVLIGQPFKVSDDLEESNNRLRNEMKELYKNCLQNKVENNVKYKD